ncbi:MAG: hypothetical protein A3A27_00740 [Candidatus Wildermuthbacteria bacterium RIFCSPLOWO2_01_FULL_47_18]|uniref:Uncharacterized protein n=1 Tax=Candidatus Wildermuthbacteria bacterium RIFCSPLOWO2_01_FULL_47_18 TaxID=1802460 RepID=A0A1G2RL24_9BACT|nr:MAG: hypothetical protein A3A27_00740 [Candidatus Wildermuthbacteria bacterium RIFCSPLOWO2_01_FULL_47_18]OHB18330.1 MAG: hypothetical protein A2749_02115 [Parcubacteria group bacterium RIFCSPHIGHO2_01_FULL_45_26]
MGKRSLLSRDKWVVAIQEAEAALSGRKHSRGVISDDDAVFIADQLTSSLGRIEQKYWDAAKEIAHRKGLGDHRPIYKGMLREWRKRAKIRAGHE